MCYELFDAACVDKFAKQQRKYSELEKKNRMLSNELENCKERLELQERILLMICRETRECKGRTTALGDQLDMNNQQTAGKRKQSTKFGEKLTYFYILR